MFLELFRRSWRRIHCLKNVKPEVWARNKVRHRPFPVKHNGAHKLLAHKKFSPSSVLTPLVRLPQAKYPELQIYANSPHSILHPYLLYCVALKLLDFFKRYVFYCRFCSPFQRKNISWIGIRVLRVYHWFFCLYIWILSKVGFFKKNPADLENFRNKKLVWKTPTRYWIYMWNSPTGLVFRDFPRKI